MKEEIREAIDVVRTLKEPALVCVMSSTQEPVKGGVKVTNHFEGGFFNTSLWDVDELIDAITAARDRKCGWLFRRNVRKWCNYLLASLFGMLAQAVLTLLRQVGG